LKMTCCTFDAAWTDSCGASLALASAIAD